VCLNFIRNISTSKGIMLARSTYFDVSSRTMALGSTQPLTEMCTRNLPGDRAAGM
jgi:hypothetical protein